MGQQTAVFAAPEGHSCSLGFQIAGVQRPLVSASQLARTGHTVEFGKDAVVIIHRQSGRRLRLQRTGRVRAVQIRVLDAATAAETPGFSWPGK